MLFLVMLGVLPVVPGKEDEARKSGVNKFPVTPLTRNYSKGEPRMDTNGHEFQKPVGTGVWRVIAHHSVRNNQSSQTPGVSSIRVDSCSFVVPSSASIRLTSEDANKADPLQIGSKLANLARHIAESVTGAARLPTFRPENGGREFIGQRNFRITLELPTSCARFVSGHLMLCATAAPSVP